MRYESDLEPGVAVVFGSEEGLVDLPGDAGAGVPAGVYDADYEFIHDNPNTEDSAPITRMGPAKVLAGGAVSAGDFGYVADATGAMVALPEDAGTYKVFGQFEQDGVAGDYVEFNVNIQQMTIAAASE